MRARAITQHEKYEIMDRLELLWLKHPELRLTQLIANAANMARFYNTEDFDFIRGLEDFYRNGSVSQKLFDVKDDGTIDYEPRE